MTTTNQFTTSQRGRDLIKKHEGFAPKVYLCPAGKPTIGYGHVVKPSEKFTIINLAQAELLLTADLRIYEIYLNGVLANSRLKVPINQNQFDACASFTFNMGMGAFDRSTLRKKIQAGDFDGAAAQFVRWKYAKVRGKDTALPGLLARRRAECALFLEPLPVPVGLESKRD